MNFLSPSVAVPGVFRMSAARKLAFGAGTAGIDGCCCAGAVPGAGALPRAGADGCCAAYPGSFGDRFVGRKAPSLVAGERSEREPEILPVTFGMDGSSPVFRTTWGSKLDTAAGRGLVALEADSLDPALGRAWSVVVKGRAFQILEIEETLRALRLPLYPWQPGRKPRFVRIEPTTVTGRRFVVDGGFTSSPPDQHAPDQHAPNQHAPNQHRDVPTTT